MTKRLKIHIGSKEKMRSFIDALFELTDKNILVLKKTDGIIIWYDVKLEIEVINVIMKSNYKFKRIWQ